MHSHNIYGMANCSRACSTHKWLAQSSNTYIQFPFSMTKMDKLLCMEAQSVHPVSIFHDKNGNLLDMVMWTFISHMYIYIYTECNNLCYWEWSRIWTMDCWFNVPYTVMERFSNNLCATCETIKPCVKNQSCCYSTGESSPLLSWPCWDTCKCSRIFSIWNYFPTSEFFQL